ncbi:MAG TPA: hypothetical protein VNY31_10405 [Solirubrobacteraceae bacterium]|jgi:hypothetical protein|nr:hypothetical protein [Solirubrobacteraceae bacterium]
MESLAVILLLALLIALILAFAKGGTTGVGTWLHAKFVGET